MVLSLEWGVYSWSQKLYILFLKHKIHKKFIFIDNLDQTYWIMLKKKTIFQKCFF